MKIGIVCYPTYGGSGVVATELGIELASEGHEVHFISYRQPVRLEGHTKNLFYHEVHVSDYPLFEYTPYELVLTNKLVEVVKYEKIDILHVHYAIPHASAALMARQILKSQGIDIPFITTLHGTDITLLGRDASFEPTITYTINQSDAVTTVSESLKADTLNHFAITNNIEVIPNFIRMSKYRQPNILELKKMYAPNQEKVLIHVSNFRKVKRVEDIISVFAKIRLQIPVKLVLIGDGPEKANIAIQCRELGACDDIKFLGKIKNTHEIIGIGDLFLLTSEFESFGLAALEAMAAGVPVISTNTGGIPEVNKNGFSGYTSNVGDVDEMADNALKVLSEEHLSTFKKNAMKQAEQFSIEKILPLYESLYRKVIG